MQVTKSFRVFAVPLFSDNYSYIIRSRQSGLLLVDPANPEVIINCLEKYFVGSTVNHILYTHKHWDHAGGAKQLYEVLHKKNMALKVYSGAEDAPHIGTVNHSIPQDSSILLQNQGLEIKTYKVPCHTRGHTLYHLHSISSQSSSHEQEEQMQTSQHKKIWKFDTEQCCFTGDTLFCGGVGRFFEGNAQEMSSNLAKINEKLSENCLIFNGHQYTKANLAWGTLAEPTNQAIKEELYKLENADQPVCSLPSNIAKQRQINVFLRAVISNNRFNLPAGKYMHLLRQAKNNGASNLENYLEKI